MVFCNTDFIVVYASYNCRQYQAYKQVFFFLQVVIREAIYYGPVDNGYETSLVSWVLPFAQRYICNSYPEKYLQHKLSGFEQLNRLQIVVVEKLFYKNVIRRPKLVSKKRHDISCFLQVFYMSNVIIIS